MRDRFPTDGLVLAALGLATLVVSAPAIAPTLTGPWHADGLHPAAALAWAEANCNVIYRIEASAPPMQADDMLRMTGDLTALDANVGHAKACAFAMDRASEVAQQADAGLRPMQPVPGPIASVR